MMPANAQVYQTTTITNSTVVNDAEIIIATIPSVSVNEYGAVVRIDAMVSIQLGEDVDELVFRVRRNVLTGPQVGNDVRPSVITETLVAAQVAVVAAEPVGLHAYVITVEVVGATTNSSVEAVVATCTVGN